MIPNWAFLSSKKKVIKHIPESKIKLIEYDKAQWLRYFGVDNKLLQMSNIGTYSIAKPQIGVQLIEFITSMLASLHEANGAKTMTVTETHGGLGGFSIPLSRIFKKVQAVEIEKVHADILKNNACVLSRGNISVVNADYMDVMKTLSQNVIVSDPPWGGQNYVDKKFLSLGINNIDITHIINELNQNKKFVLFVLLVPANYDFNKLVAHLDPRLLHNLVVKLCTYGKKKYYYIGIFGES